MGRIAEALKKAERERAEKLQAESLGKETATATLEAVPEPGTASPDVLAEEPARPVRSVSEGMSESLVTYYDTSSLITEQYRSLRTRLLSMNPDNEHRILAITSAVPKEGKSVTALNTAFILAEVQHLKVIVVDGDFRRSSLARLLNQPSSPGLASALQNHATLDDAIQPTPLPNLSFLPAGKMEGASATELLASEAMPAVFRSLQDRFHYTLVDTPPATTVTDVGIIGQMCNAVIMVIRMNRTPDPVVRRAVRLLQVNNIPVAGCILAGHNERASNYGYYYGYYPYRRYYHDYYYRSGRDEDKQ